MTQAPLFIPYVRFTTGSLFAQMPCRGLLVAQAGTIDTYDIAWSKAGWLLGGLGGLLLHHLWTKPRIRQAALDREQELRIDPQRRLAAPDIKHKDGPLQIQELRLEADLDKGRFSIFEKEAPRRPVLSAAFVHGDDTVFPFHDAREAFDRLRAHFNKHGADTPPDTAAEHMG